MPPCLGYDELNHGVVCICGIKLEPIDNEISAIKEELKQINPNCARAHKRIAEKRRLKDPVTVIINK